MSFVQMRTVPGLWVGRRTVVQANVSTEQPGATAYRCGACDEVVLKALDRSELRDVVVKCGCGELNQL